MSRAKQMTGKTFVHSYYGRVKVLKAISRVKVLIKCTDKGKHWDELNQCYRDIKSFIPNLNDHGQKIGMTYRKTIAKKNPLLGAEDVCHIKELMTA